MKQNLVKIAWIGLILLTMFLFTCIAFLHGEQINAAWLVLTGVLFMLLGYRFYSLFIAKWVLKLDAKAITPAVKYNDGLDYVPTHRFVVFGHHFAAIAGAGPLVGPVLAAQMGYLPGFLWILIGCVFAGAVQDFIILTISLRHDAKSLGELIKSELGAFPGTIALISTLIITILVLGILALVVVKALMHSPWSFFSVASTIPIAMFMGLYMQYLRPGKVGEASLIGVLLLLTAIFAGYYIANDVRLAPWFNYDGQTIAIMLTIYGFIAAALPVWLLLAPRDYLSTFLKIGTVLMLAIGIFLIRPVVQMPSLTPFIHGNGPVWSGSLFPFLFITIACGAVSGFHSLIASGTTPKLISNEKDARFIGYGAMLMEGFVAIMALVVACCLSPGVYFALNSPPAIIGTTVQSAALTISQWGFALTPSMLTDIAQSIGEISILSRTGGAPTLAIGMASLFAQLFDNSFMLSFWYHFAILFEALFILTAVDAGTRVARFMLQDLIGTFIPSFKNTNNGYANIIATGMCAGGWGYFLYEGVLDPNGGINNLWPLFGISNQMLAGIALTLATIYLARKHPKYSWVTLIPTLWLLICTIAASIEKVFSSNIKIGFLAQAHSYQTTLMQMKDTLTIDTQTLQTLVTSNYINAALAGGFTLVLVYIFLQGMYKILHWYKLHNKGKANA